MDAMEFLSRPMQASNRLRRAQEKVTALKSLTERVTTKFGLDSVSVAHTPNVSAMQDTIILLTEAEEEEQRLREELAVVEMKVGAVLAKLSDERLYDFMVNRFLDFMTIEAAANEVGFSYSWGRLAVERGVAEVQEILDGMEADVHCGSTELTGANSLWMQWNSFPSRCRLATACAVRRRKWRH